MLVLTVTLVIFVVFRLMLLDHVVHIVVVAVEVLVVLGLILIRDLLSHSAFPSLRDDLRLGHLPSLGKFGALLDGIGRENPIVGILLELVTIRRNLLLVRDDTDTFAAIERGVGDLGLEGEGLHLGQIQVLHLHQIFDTLQSILKGDLSFLSYVSHISHHEGFVL